MNFEIICFKFLSSDEHSLIDIPSWQSTWISNGENRAEDDQSGALREYFDKFYPNKKLPKILWIPIQALKTQDLFELNSLAKENKADRIILVADANRDDISEMLTAYNNQDMIFLNREIDIIFGKGLTIEQLTGCFVEQNITRLSRLQNRAEEINGFQSVGKPTVGKPTVGKPTVGKPTCKQDKLVLFTTHFLPTLYAHWGPHSVGMRNWLYFTLLFLLAIVLLASFPYLPLVAVVTLIGLKIFALMGFVLCLTMGIKGIVDEYYRREVGVQDYFWLPYLRDLWRENFVLSDKARINLIKWGIGLLLFAVVVTLLVCTSGAGIVIPVITGLVHFTATSFATAGIFVGSSWFTAVFLGVLVMTGYEVLSDIIVEDIDRSLTGRKELSGSATSAAKSYRTVTQEISISCLEKKAEIKGEVEKRVDYSIPVWTLTLPCTSNVQESDGDGEDEFFSNHENLEQLVL